MRMDEEEIIQNLLILVVQFFFFYASHCREYAGIRCNKYILCTQCTKFFRGSLKCLTHCIPEKKSIDFQRRKKKQRRNDFHFLFF